MTEKKCKVTHMPHHMQQKLCKTRPPYRQGKKLTAVKVALGTSVQQVYTINDESQHLLLCGIPALKLGNEVEKLVQPYGEVKAIELITEYPSEEFTETYHIHYARIQSASLLATLDHAEIMFYFDRAAKRAIDNKNFFGGLLHICYLPELETLTETRAKLEQRRNEVARQIKRNQQDLTNPEVDTFVPREQYHRKKKNPALPLTEDRLKHCYPGETLTSICSGIPQNIDPRRVTEPSLPINWNSSTASGSDELPALNQLTEAVIQPITQQPNVTPNSNVRKRKNYKGQRIDNSVKVKIFRPQLVDTRKLAKPSSTAETKSIFYNVKKIESGITVKLLKNSDSEKKKIVIKDPNVTHLIKPSEDLQSSIQAAKSKIRNAMQRRNT